MGVKRPVEEELEFSSKQTKLHDDYYKLLSPTEAFPLHGAPQKADGPDEADREHFRFQQDKEVENENLNAAVSHLADKDVESSAPISWLTSSSSEEDAGSGEAIHSSVFPDLFELNFSGRTLVQLENPYSSLLSSSPRREVPVGPDHQVDIPSWDPHAIGKDPLGCNTIINGDEELKLLGTVIIPMPSPEISSFDNIEIGSGRTDCCCLDVGSVRCVRQHVNEAREKLMKAIGDENFADLGFYEMGEEVANNWSDEEERVFHEVIFLNPVSIGKNFWKNLDVVFPTRTRNEIVSYYFNVFMLRRRAVQNRSSSLEIDSDDDEWHGESGGFDIIGDDDEDSVVESFDDQDVHVDAQYALPYENYVNGDEINDGASDREDDVRAGMQRTIGNDDGHDNSDLACELHHVHKSRANLAGDSDIQEDSIAANVIQSHLVGLRSSTLERMPKNDHKRCFEGNSNGSSDGMTSGFLLEDAKVWDDNYPTGLMRNVDLLPTCSMIEEIFGASNWSGKSSNDKTVS